MLGTIINRIKLAFDVLIGRFDTSNKTYILNSYETDDLYLTDIAHKHKRNLLVSCSICLAFLSFDYPGVKSIVGISLANNDLIPKQTLVLLSAIIAVYEFIMFRHTSNEAKSKHNKLKSNPEQRSITIQAGFNYDFNKHITEYWERFDDIKSGHLHRYGNEAFNLRITNIESTLKNILDGIARTEDQLLSSQKLHKSIGAKIENELSTQNLNASDLQIAIADYIRAINHMNASTVRVLKDGNVFINKFHEDFSSPTILSTEAQFDILEKQLLHHINDAKEQLQSLSSIQDDIKENMFRTASNDASANFLNILFPKLFFGVTSLIVLIHFIWPQLI